MAGWLRRIWSRWGSRAPTREAYDELLAQRVVFLGTPILNDTATIVIAQLLFLDDQSHSTPIRLVLNTPGGSVSDGLAILDTIDAIACPVHTYAIDEVSGVAVNLLAHGATGERVVLAHTRVRLTPIRSPEPAPGPADIARTESAIVELLAADCDRSRKQIAGDLRKARSFTAGQAVAYGLVDRIESRD